LGCSDTFSRPDFKGGGGLPVNIELLLHRLQERFGQTLDWFELPLAVFQLHSILDETEDYWERGPGASPANLAGIFHNLAIYGWMFATSTIPGHPQLGRGEADREARAADWLEVPQRLAGQ